MKAPVLRALRPRRIRTRLLLGVVAVQILAMAALTGTLVVRQRRFLRAESLQEAETLAGTLAVNSVSWVLANDVEGLDEVVVSVRRDPDVAYAMVLSREGLVLAHTDPRRRGTFLSDPESRGMLNHEAGPFLVAEARDVVDVAAPVMAAGRPVGWVRVAVDQTKIARSLRAVLWTGLGVGLLAAAVSAALAIVVGRRLTSGVAGLLDLSARIRNGRRDVRADVSGEDEVAELGRGLNEMIDALAGGEERVRLLLDSTAEGILGIGPDGRCVFCNAAAVALLGWSSPEDLLGTEVHERVHRGQAEANADGRECAIVALLEGRSERHRADDTFIRADGTAFPVEIRACPVIRDGASIGVVVTFVDISDRIQAEEALRRAEEKYRRFFEEDLAGHFISTPDGRILECNPAFARTFGFESTEELRALGAGSIYLDPGDRVAFLEDLTRHRRLERITRDFRHRDGHVVHVLQSVVGTFDEKGELVEIHGFFIDETERWAAEEKLRQAQKMEAVGRLAGGVAHDFNNILTIILGYLEIVRPSLSEADPRRADLAEVEAAAQRAAALTRQLLAFSRRQVLRPALIDLNAVVRDVEKMLRRLIGEDIKVTTDLAPGLGTVLADQGQIEQVLMNLVVNARDAMPDGGRLTIATANEGGGPEARVVLTVRDTGCGMDREVLGRLFEPFYTTKEAGKGTGLGLATVYGIVKQSGGDVRVESEPGRGSTFCVSFPRAAGTPASRAPEILVAPPSTSCTVAIAEDDLALRSLAGKVLQQAGYDVVVCGTPEDVLAWGGAHPGRIDVLLSDVVMPGMRGPELARRLAATHPETRVLYMSGYTDNEIARQGVLQSDVRLLQKPFTKSALLAAVREAVDTAPAAGPS